MWACKPKLLDNIVILYLFTYSHNICHVNFLVRCHGLVRTPQKLCDPWIKIIMTIIERVSSLENSKFIKARVPACWIFDDFCFILKLCIEVSIFKKLKSYLQLRVVGFGIWFELWLETMITPYQSNTDDCDFKSYIQQKYFSWI